MYLCGGRPRDASVAEGGAGGGGGSVTIGCEVGGTECGLGIAVVGLMDATLSVGGSGFGARV